MLSNFILVSSIEKIEIKTKRNLDKVVLWWHKYDFKMSLNFDIIWSKFELEYLKSDIYFHSQINGGCDLNQRSTDL